MDSGYVIGPLTGAILSQWNGNTVWQRIEQALHHKGLSVAAFEKEHRVGHMGPFTAWKVRTGEKPNFGQAMKSEDFRTAQKWVLKVLECYPEYSYDWLMYGEGEALREPFRASR